jgi:hypothetical protein
MYYSTYKGSVLFLSRLPHLLNLPRTDFKDESIYHLLHLETTSGIYTLTCLCYICNIPLFGTHIYQMLPTGRANKLSFVTMSCEMIYYKANWFMADTYNGILVLNIPLIRSKMIIQSSTKYYLILKVSAALDSLHIYIFNLHIVKIFSSSVIKI